LLAVVISEIAVSDSTGGDWVELHNNGGVSANISGWKISDAANSFSIPANTHLAPHEFRRFVVQPPVNLSRNGPYDNQDTVTLRTSSNVIVDGPIAYPEQVNDSSWGILMKTDAYKAQVEARLLEILPVGPVGQPNPFSLAGIVQPIEAALDELDTAIRGEIVRYPHATHSNWTVDKGELRENVPYRNRGELIFDYAVILDAMLLTDYHSDGRLDFRDINAFAAAIRSQSAPVSTHDLNGDQQVDVHDLIVLVNFYLGTFIGDADLDGLFNSADFVFVLTAGKYENGETFDWREGDWNGDGVFDSNDILFAFQGGGYDPS
jgi:hypothetical protein